MKPLWAAGHCRFPQLPFRRLFVQVKRPIPLEANVVTAYNDGTVTLRTNRRVDGYHEAADLSGFQGVRPGDFVVHGLDILHGAVGISDSAGAISSVCVVCVPRASVEPRFFAYAIRAQSFSGFPRALARGVREGGADFRRWDTLAELPLPVPTTPVQRAIADYLDAETSRIDALIAKKRRMSKLLDERRQALVDATLQGKGRKVRVRHLTRRITSGPRGWAEYIADEGVPFIRITNVPASGIELDLTNLVYVVPPGGAERERTKVREGDVLVSITAEIGSVGIVRRDLSGAAVSQHVALITPRGCLPEWLAFSLTTSTSRAQQEAARYGGTKTQLGLEDVANIEIGLVNVSEQAQLLRQLASGLPTIERLQECLEQQCALLVEHRQALITATVTGEHEISRAAA